MNTPAPTPTEVTDLVRVALVMLGIGFLLTAVGSVWTVLTPAGTGVNFPAGLLFVLGPAVGALGLVFDVVAVVALSKAARRR